MQFDPERVRTLTFDSYGTVVDVGSASAALEGHVADPVRAARRWRVHSLMYTLVANAIDAYQPFYEMNRDALSHALETFGADVDDETREEILSVYLDLDVFEDVRPGLERLTDEYDCYVVSNGDPEMLAAMVELARVGELLAGTVSADEVETFKPHPRIYRHAAARTGTPVEDIAHVSAGWLDVQGAAHAGMQDVWVNREDEPWVRFDGEPDLEVGSFEALADVLGT